MNILVAAGSIAVLFAIYRYYEDRIIPLKLRYVQLMKETVVVLIVAGIVLYFMGGELSMPLAVAGSLPGTFGAGALPSTFGAVTGSLPGTIGAVTGSLPGTFGAVAGALRPEANASLPGAVGGAVDGAVDGAAAADGGADGGGDAEQESSHRVRMEISETAQPQQQQSKRKRNSRRHSNNIHVGGFESDF